MTEAVIAAGGSSAPPPAVISFVNNQGQVGGTATYPSPITAGNCLICGLCAEADTLGLDTLPEFSLIATVAAGSGIGPSVATWAELAAEGDETGSFTPPLSSPSATNAAVITQWSNDAARPFTVAGTTGVDTDATGTTVDVTASSVGDFQAGDMAVFYIGGNDDATIPITSPVLTIPGCTLDTVSTIQQLATTIGTDVSVSVFSARVLTGAQTGAARFTGTAAFAGFSRVAAAFLRLRA